MFWSRDAFYQKDFLAIETSLSLQKCLYTIETHIPNHWMNDQ